MLYVVGSFQFISKGESECVYSCAQWSKQILKNISMGKIILFPDGLPVLTGRL